MAVFEIPLISQNQTLSIILGGVTYDLTVTWNPSMSTWVIDIRDINDNDILLGIPMVTGIDLLAQYEYIGIDGNLIVQTDFNPNEQPTFTDLGSTSHLYFITSDVAVVTS